MEFDKTKYDIVDWKNFAMLHWILNPGLVVNELLFGQRVAKITLVEKPNGKTLYQRIKIPCPHCGTIHSHAKWYENNNGFKNWFGLYCDQCGKIIPCQFNLTSLIFLTITFPIWFLFKNKLKEAWLKKQPDRFKNLNLEEDPISNNWILTGMVWAVMMFILSGLIFPYFSGEPITLKKIIIGLVIWTLGGLSYGFYIKQYMNKK